MSAVMTEPGGTTLVGDFAGMVNDLMGILDAHSVGDSMCLMVRPPAAPQGTIYVQVQRADGVVELHPRNVSELRPGDLVHDTQVAFDPADKGFTDYITGPLKAGRCFGVTGRPGHFYD